MNFQSVMTKHADSLEATDEKRLELEDKLSEIYQTLGEVSIENENYPQAIEDLTMCLRRRQDLNPEDARVIAETHYQLGMISHKMSLLTIFGHKHFRQKFHQNFYIFHEKFSTAFDSYLASNSKFLSKIA